MLTTKQARQTSWSFLRKNPEYNEYWLTIIPPRKAELDKSSFPLHWQKDTDLTAQKWGLFAYADPTISPETISPFWSITPTLEAEIVPDGKLALLPVLREARAVISGLFLLNGDLILKIECDEATVQLRIKDGLSFNETSGLILRLPVGLKLPLHLTRSIDFWNIAAGERFKKLENPIMRITTSFCLFLMACSLERATAR